MIGLVIVSHSRSLAEALVNLLKQVAPPEVPVAVAAGIGDDRQQFGTDAVEISQVIQSVYSQEGVIILMDLGSAVLSAEMALELLPPEMAANICFCPAPLVEGAIAASVQIGLGSDLDTVCKEAERALLPKTEHLQSHPAEEQTAVDSLESPSEGVQESQIDIILNNQHGLHARPAARFVQTAARFQTNMQVANRTTGKGPVPATSLNGLTTLGAIKGHQIRITASGPEAQQALETMRLLVENNFGESTDSPNLPPSPPNVSPGPDNGLSTYQATPISDGYALGALFHFMPTLPPIPQYAAKDIAQEKSRLEKAIQQTRQGIEQQYHQIKTNVGDENAAIFEAHLLFLKDPVLITQVFQRIESQQENAAVAWSSIIKELEITYRSLPDPYQQQRATDVMDIGNQVLFALLGEAPPTPVVFHEPVILFTQEITPTQTAQFDMSHVLGILTTSGGPTSHSAILARALGIPSITGVPPSFGDIKPGTLVGIDGFTGKIHVAPTPKILNEIEAARREWLNRRQQLIETSHEPALTRDGHRVEVFANVGNVLDARSAVQNGTEGIGLLRTEFLFLTRETPPGEDEQISALQEIFRVMGDRPVTIRTLDVGGDKKLPYIPLAEEANPFLGVRAIRMSLNQPDLFLTQLRAILRAGDNFKVRIMFPMIALVDEVHQAQGWLEKAHQALLAEKLPHAWPVETGIMVEIPSTAILSHAFAPEVNFFSIGTNDLTQYTLAAERGNPLLTGLSDALHPSVLRLIKEVTTAAHAIGKWVGVCGELAGDAEATAVLVGLGVDELSLNPGGIPRIKTILRQINTGQAAALADQALQTTSAEEVRHLAQEFMKSVQLSRY